MQDSKKREGGFVYVKEKKLSKQDFLLMKVIIFLTTGTVLVFG